MAQQDTILNELLAIQAYHRNGLKWATKQIQKLSPAKGEVSTTPKAQRRETALRIISRIDRKITKTVAG